MNVILSEQSTARKFLLTGLVFIVLFSSLIIYRDWVDKNRHLEELLTAQATMGVEFDLAIRDYVAQTIRPFAESATSDGTFIPEVMSTSYVARDIFERVRHRFPDYILKFSSDNPRNPANQAGPDELEMIAYFNANPGTETWTGYTTLDNTSYLATFRARRAKESCLRCHGNPESAPASLTNMYGTAAGFHRPAGEVIALDTVAIPAENNRSFIIAGVIKESSILIFGLIVSAVVIYFILRRLVSKLQEQNTFLHTVIDSMSYPFSVINANDFSIELANSHALREGHPGGCHCYEVTHHREQPCDDPDHPCMVAEVKKTRSPVVLEHIHYDPEGRCQFVEVHGCPIVDKNGDVKQVIEYSVDITERKATEQKMHESEQRISSILHSLSSGIIVIDATSHQVLDINQSAADMIGLSKDQILGRVCHNFLCPTQEGACPVTDLGQCVNRSERVLLRADGSNLPVLKTATLVEINGRQCIVENFFDLTVQKETEKALRESREQAENTAEMKSRFLANMSHEIRTPMNSIIGFSDLLFDEALSVEQREYLEMISSNGKQLLQLINDILDFSKIDAGKLSISPQPCSTVKILSEIEAMVGPFISKKNLAFEILIDEDLPEVITTDGARLKQCLINLVNNAIKFTEVGGVCVHAKKEQVQNKTFIRFNVEDTGIGISPEKQDKIFESFTQADDSTSRKYGGTGLGLAITRQLAGLLGGSLTLSSQEGVGSVFSLEIASHLESPEAEPVNRSAF